jgi:hypothetical protein
MVSSSRMHSARAAEDIYQRCHSTARRSLCYARLRAHERASTSRNVVASTNVIASSVPTQTAPGLILGFSVEALRTRFYISNGLPAIPRSAVFD